MIFSLEIDVNSPESPAEDVNVGFPLEIEVSRPESPAEDVFQEAEEVDGVVNPDTSQVNGSDVVRDEAHDLV